MNGAARRDAPGVDRTGGRIHFAGAYADNLHWGMEAATRSAQRVVAEIGGNQQS